MFLVAILMGWLYMRQRNCVSDDCPVKNGKRWSINYDTAEGTEGTFLLFPLDTASK